MNHARGVVTQWPYYASTRQRAMNHARGVVTQWPYYASTQSGLSALNGRDDDATALY